MTEPNYTVIKIVLFRARGGGNSCLLLLETEDI
jgi:hypothetical protein